MKWIITIAISIIFVVTSLFAVFNVGRALNIGFDYLLDTGYCEYRPDKAEECGFNPDRAKDDVAEAGAIVLATAPMAWFTYRKIRKQI